MAFKTIEFNVESGVATLTLNRPDRLNSFNTEMHGGYRKILPSVVFCSLQMAADSVRGRTWVTGQYPPKVARLISVNRLRNITTR